MNSPDDLIVVTGGPGSGKSTLVELLQRAGFATAPEAGRAIIRDQVAIGGCGLPWVDAGLFAELMLCWELRSYRWAQQQPGPVFFDHALPGLPGYYRLIGTGVPGYVEAAVAALRYRRLVFIAPPWPGIYRTDAQRRQSFQEAVRTYEVLADAYQRYGYQLVELPLTSPGHRLEFVLEHIGLTGPPGGPSAPAA